ncbi:MAG: 3-hydroxybutyryl-CoA dehydrogenase [Rhodothermales bacterium]|nr:3-hydroxybutyryl-CoA dehydrogenase [Rhodothermales bacterium]
MRIAVIGGGTMGSGIGQIAATHGHQTVIVDSSKDQLKRSKAGLQKILARLVEKGRLTRDESVATLDRISFSTDIEATSGSGLVVEAIIEDLAAKQAVFDQIEKHVDSSAIIATNTSSLSVTSVAGSCKEPQRVAGMHFFNPAPVMALVEIVPGVATDESTINAIMNVARSWGKVPVVVKDTPGFIVNRVARCFYSESLRIVDEGLATPAEVDEALRSAGFRMGPFELMDLIGNDINLAVTRSVFAAFHFDQRYKPSFTQERLVEAGRLGRKSGSGYFMYGDDAEKPAVDLGSSKAAMIIDRVVAMIINDAIDTVFWGVASPGDVDIAMTKGVNYPRGPIEWGKEIGYPVIIERIESLRSRYMEDRYRVSPLLRDLASNQVDFDG